MIDVADPRERRGYPDSFVGRVRELTKLRDLLGRHRMVTVLGTGGCGKTRLAIELADRTTGRVAVVRLDSLTSGTPAQAVAAELGIREAPGTPLLDTIAERLRSDQLLLVLDNCEHVLACAADLVSSLLARCPQLRVLATSRQALDIPGEMAFPLGELPLPLHGSTISPAGALRSDAIRLFVDRARTAAPGFVLTQQNAATVSRLCVDLDGLPLAIELAARRVATMSVDDMLGRLACLLDLHSEADPRRPRRHRDLRSVIGWSYDLLTAHEQAVCRRLAVLGGPFDVEAAVAVCADDEVPAENVLMLLANLELKSLLVTVRSDDSAACFRQLGSVRDFGRERLASSGELLATTERLVSWMMRHIEPVVETPLPADAPVAWLTGRVALIRTAAEYADPEDDERHGALVATFARASALLGSPSAGRDWLRSALHRAPHSKYLPFLLVHASWLAGWLGDDEAIEHAEAAVAIERTHGPTPRLARALSVLAHAGTCRRDLDAARAHLLEAIELSTALGSDCYIVAALRHKLAWVSVLRNDSAQAAELVAAALPVYRERGDDRGLTYMLRTAGALALMRDDIATAEACFREAAERGSANHAAFPSILGGMAVVAARSGRPERAITLHAAMEMVQVDRNLRMDPTWRAHVDEAVHTATATVPAARRTWLVGFALSLNPAQLAEIALHDNGLPPRPDLCGLSPREYQVATLVASGLHNRQIAAELTIAPSTVSSHIKKIFGKLGLRSRAELGAWRATHPCRP